VRLELHDDETPSSLCLAEDVYGPFSGQVSICLSGYLGSGKGPIKRGVYLSGYLGSGKGPIKRGFYGPFSGQVKLLAIWMSGFLQLPTSGFLSRHV
jgi:tRNA A37 threonylcarbamoyladenosine biosynthesis protein TsaE